MLLHNCINKYILFYSLISPITRIVKQSIEGGLFPSVWKTAVITPVFKAGNPMVTSNYRPISNLPSESKVAEKWISEQIITHLNASSFSLHPLQFGFRKHHSTETAKCYLLENIKARVDKGGVVVAVYLDLKKAFDTVNHDILIAKLTMFNFSSNVTTWIKSYLAEKKQCVRIGDKISQIVKNCVVSHRALL